MKRAIGLAIALGLAAPALAQNFGPPELIEAARKEGALVFYTANIAEVEQLTIKAFNQRFPFIKIELLRAPGGQLITRVKTEVASGKLRADIIDHSDRALLKEMEDLFQDYAPPNGADYLPEAMVSRKLWPRLTLVWSIAYNSELVKNPPKSWMDLTKPEYGNKRIGQVLAPSGGTTWTRAMFERQVLGEDYWKKQAATQPVLFPSNAPASDALVRGEVVIAPLLYNTVYPKKREGAPIEIFFPPEGAPVTPFAAGIPKTAANPNAARLFLNWCLSEEGQTFMIKELGNLTSLKVAPVYPEGFDPKVVKVWVPNLRSVREAAPRLDRRMEQDLQLSPMSPANKNGCGRIRRKGVTMLKPILIALGVVLATAAGAQNFGPPELIEAAKKEGRLVFYTANFAEVEQEVIKAFNKRFPEIRIEMVRAPGGQLITRIKTEAAAGKLAADVVNHSDRGLMLEIENLFQDYAPPNAADYRPDVLVSPKFWPQATLGWVIAYNSELVKNPPKSWMDLTKPQYKGKQIGQTIGPSGGTTWTRIMFERQVLGEDYWQKQAATEVTLYPSGAPASDSLVRGEISILPSLYNIVFTKQRDGAPIEIVLAARGHADQSLRRRHSDHRQEHQRRQAVPQLVPVGRGPGLHDQGAGQLHLAQEPAGAPQGLRSQDGEVLGAGLQAVSRAAFEVDRGLEPRLQLSPVRRFMSALLEVRYEGTSMSAR